jgi:ADP-ribose pyrophosphatase YjhB (NUDIX family)
MKFCSECGNPVVQKVPAGDNRERFVCEACQAIHYQNPRAVVGTIPVFEGQVLLCRRSIEPRHGFWTLPAGFLENGETAEEGALRETIEETRATVTCHELYRIFNVVQANQMHLFFRAELQRPDFGPTSESSEVQLFSFDEIPWSDLAFPTVHKTLLDFRQDRLQQSFSTQMDTITIDYWRKMLSPEKH